jgi:hypothetical protein
MSLPIIFGIFYTGCILVFVFRRFDLFTIALFSSTVYFLPAFFGVTHDATLPLVLNEIGLLQYSFYFFYFGLLTTFASVHSCFGGSYTQSNLYHLHGNRLQKDVLELKLICYICSFLGLAFFALSWMQMGVLLFSPDKQDVLENLSFFYGPFQFSSLICLFTSFVLKQRITLILGVGLVGLDLYVGFRLVGALSVIMCFGYMYFGGRSKLSMAIFAMLICMAYIVGNAYKLISVALKQGDLDAGVVRLLDVENIYEALLLTESFTTQEVFRRIIESGFSLPIEYVLNFFRMFFPFVGNALFGKPMGFNDYYQGELYPHVLWGMGSNVWAEHLAVWGWIGPIALVLVLFALLYWANHLALRWWASQRLLMFVTILFFAVPFFFYIHRNDLLFQLAIARNQFVGWLMLLLLVRVLSAWVGKRSSA